MDWDPVQYLKFADERLRPGFDLLARIGELPPGPITELGCGTGVHTSAIAARWPERAVTGLDLSAEMLGQAAAQPSQIRWEQGDIAAWQAAEKQALVFSSATLHWVDDHPRLMLQLMRQLAAGGVLAIQMPRNFQAPSHLLMREIAASGPWAQLLAPLLRHDPVASPEAYYDLLAPLSRGDVDFWETEYLHVLAGPADGESAVLAWNRGTALRPLLEPLTASEQRDFAARYDAALKAAYPRRADGKTLLPFRRLFMIVRA
jgi:trans-aconitate 2-methyltransferase